MAYIVEIIKDCTFVYSLDNTGLPVRDVVDLLTKAELRSEVVDLDLADISGAILVVGKKHDLNYLRGNLTLIPLSEKRQESADKAMTLGLPLLAQWFTQGECGLSSKAMCKQFYGLPIDANDDHPLDWSDFGRCIKFVRQTHSEDLITKMKDVSPEWSRIADKWLDLVVGYEQNQTTSTRTPFVF